MRFSWNGACQPEKYETEIWHVVLWRRRLLIDHSMFCVEIAQHFPVKSGRFRYGSPTGPSGKTSTGNMVNQHFEAKFT